MNRNCFLRTHNMIDDLNYLADKIYNLVQEAGTYAKNMRKQIYKNGFLPFDLDELLVNTETFSAPEDFRMSDFICDKLQKISSIPIVSEENAHKLSDDTFWCIDPLDGTYCFSHNTGPYAILISLIYHGYPILGLARYPEENITYVGAKTIPSYIFAGNKKHRLTYNQCKSGSLRGIISNASPESAPIIKYLNGIGISNFIEVTGCPNPALTLSGKGDIMPLFHRQYEWDTAAYDAILRYSNSAHRPCFFDTHGQVLKYGKYTGAHPFENPKVVVTPNEALKLTIRNNLQR